MHTPSGRPVAALRSFINLRSHHQLIEGIDGNDVIVTRLAESTRRESCSAAVPSTLAIDVTMAGRAADR